eukprot:4169082-Pyramimonas_sp.AAC.2
MMVLAFPPSEFFSSHVSVLSRYETCFPFAFPPPSDSALRPPPCTPLKGSAAPGVTWCNTTHTPFKAQRRPVLHDVTPHTPSSLDALPHSFSSSGMV